MESPFGGVAPISTEPVPHLEPGTATGAFGVVLMIAETKVLEAETQLDNFDSA